MEGAFVAWYLAIRSKIAKHDPEQSIQDLARGFATGIATQENLDTVSEWFNWDQIISDLRLRQ